MKRLCIVLAALLPLTALAFPASAASAPTGGGSGTACTTAVKPHIPGARIQSMTAVAHPGGTLTFPPKPPSPTPPPITGVPAYCDMTVTLTHPGVGDRVRIQMWLPFTRWNERFQAIGGGGFTADQFKRRLAPAVKNGYAASWTDAGIGIGGTRPPTRVLDKKGNINRGLLANFAYRSAHEMSLVGEQMIAGFYGRPAAHSYWNGCSTGGRQGLMEAQRYPKDFDGIVAASPAINWERFIMAEFWPRVVLSQARTHPTACEFAAFHKAAIAACDRDDGVADRVVGRPEACRFNPSRLVGKTIICKGKPMRISRAHAAIVRKIWDGPRTASGKRLWSGLLRDVPIDRLAAIAAAHHARRHGQEAPFPVADAWMTQFLKRQPGTGGATMGHREFERLFRQLRAAFDATVGTGNANLSRFRDAGGKMITWHGLADRPMFLQGMTDYRGRVESVMGGARATDRFYRHFTAPGANACSGGAGPVPTDPLAAVVDWVEKGRAPDTLAAAMTNAAGQRVSRNLCRYPLVSRYTGHGNRNSAAGHVCVSPQALAATGGAKEAAPPDPRGAVSGSPVVRPAPRLRILPSR